MHLPWLSRWLSRKPQAARRDGRRGPALRLEELEPRWVPADYYLVRGTADAQTTLLFHFNLRNTLFNNEIGVYTVNGDNGAVTATGSTTPVLPGASNYASTVLGASTTQVLFSSGQGIGAEKTLSFAGGTLLGFYLVQNGTTAAAKANNSTNQLNSVGPTTFFSFDAANPDGFRHTNSVLYGDGSAQFNWNDQAHGGDRSFKNAVFTVGVAAGSASSLPGFNGQSVPVSFTLDSRKGNFHDEIGVFTVDSIDGRIGNLMPGQAGWVQMALSNTNEHVVFTRDQGAGAVSPIILPGGGRFGMYLVQDSTSANLLSQNPSDLSGQLPQVFFSFVAANPDQFQHLRWLDSTHFVWEDETGGGDQDFADVTGTVTVGAPTGTPTQPTPPPTTDQGPPTVSTPINDVSVAQNAANTTLDLAGNFSDPDIVDGNTTVTMNTSSGAINLSLLDKTAPQTVANFVDYVNNGSYNNSIFHRLASLSGSGAPQIIQGGGFALQTDSTTGSVTNITSIPQGPAVVNEFNQNHPDVAGTIAMAKLGSDPNSATNQFFFNLTDNSQTLGSNNNGGFTVFGTVDATGQQTLNQMVTLDSVKDQSTFNGAFNTIPLPLFSGSNNDPNFPRDTMPNMYDLINSVTIHQNDALTYQVVFNNNSNLVTATIQNERLTLHYTPNMIGQATITVQATDKAGKTVTANFHVNVR